MCSGELGRPSRWMGLSLLLACQGGGEQGTLEDPVLTDANNFSFTSAVDIPMQAAAAQQDIWVSWEGLTEDQLGLPFDADDVSDVAIVVFGESTEQEIEAKVAADTVRQSDVSLFVSCTPEGPGCWLSDFTVQGTDPGLVELFEEDSGIWMVSLASSQGAGRAARYRRLLFLEPQSESSEEQADFIDGEGLFEVSVELGELERVSVSATEPVTLGWSELTRNGLGAEVALFKLDLLSLAWIADADDSPASLDALEASFLTLEADADGLWELDVAGRTEASLDELEGFPGFDAGGLWLLGLRCGTCVSPMPVFLTVLEPR